jgi:hypothetical protein
MLEFKRFLTYPKFTDVWSSCSGKRGRHGAEFLVVMQRKTWSPWSGIYKKQKAIVKTIIFLLLMK